MAIWSDVPTNGSGTFSHPGVVLWSQTFSNGQYCGRFMMTPNPGSMPPLQARLVAAWPRRRHLLLSLIQFKNVWL